MKSTLDAALSEDDLALVMLVFSWSLGPLLTSAHIPWLSGYQSLDCFRFPMAMVLRMISLTGLFMENRLWKECLLLVKKCFP